jgi:geranylgeranyl diphosphate synthase type I
VNRQVTDLVLVCATRSPVDPDAVAEAEGDEIHMSGVGLASVPSGLAVSGDVHDSIEEFPFGVSAAAVVESGLRSTVNRLPDSVRHVAAYHFGWCDERGLPTKGSLGKMFRSGLTLTCASAVGGRRQKALDAAVAVELVHNFTLLHDDVIDGDSVRRHRPAVWSVFGAPMAILVGDALLVKAFETLANTPAAIGHFGRSLLEVVQGQGLDMAFEHATDVSLDECLAMAGGKTAALIRCAAELGAGHGGGSPAQVAALGEFGWHLGLAFQLRDDLLGIWGNPARTGKPALSDLRARKRSLPVVAALASQGEAAQQLAELYRRTEPLSDPDLLVAASLVDEAGGRRWAEAEVGRQVEAALTNLVQAEPAPLPAARLRAVAQAAGARTA